jgi:hypothetical protein
MKAQELRIGNLVYGVSDRIEQIVQISGTKVTTDLVKISAPMEIELTDISPIELTEEWLLKFGFEERLGGRFFKHSWFYLDPECAGVSGWYFRSIDAFKAKTQYVHQLQNLYFALTGEELTIKQE